MKDFSMSLRTTDRKKGEERVITYKTEISLGSETRFSSLVDFMKELKVIWKKAMTASKHGAFIEMEVIESVYEGGYPTNDPLVQKSFDRWFFDGYNTDEEGIYLSADTKYTKAERDMYLTKDLLDDLAFTLL